MDAVTDQGRPTSRGARTSTAQAAAQRGQEEDGAERRVPARRPPRWRAARAPCRARHVAARPARAHRLPPRPLRWPPSRRPCSRWWLPHRIPCSGLMCTGMASSQYSSGPGSNTPWASRVAWPTSGPCAGERVPRPERDGRVVAERKPPVAGSAGLTRSRKAARRRGGRSPAAGSLGGISAEPSR